MTALAAPLVALREREWLVAGLIAAFAGTLLAAVGPAGGDVPAHLYRTWLVEQGIYVWDNLWFAGQYPLVSYSLFYYPVAALVGNVQLVLFSVVASAALFQRVCEREWGDAAVWPSRAFALLAAAPLFTGTYSYAAGVAALLATLAALQAGRASIAVGCAALTLGFSPLAFVFLVLVLGALVLSRRRLGRKAAVFAVGLTVAVALQAWVLQLFPTDGRYPFRGVELVTVLAVCAIGVLLAGRAPRGGVLTALFALWFAVSVVLFLVPEPVGENVTRMRSAVFPLMLLTVLLARFRPRWLAALGLAGALAYNVAPYATTVSTRLDTRPAAQEFWTPAVTFLQEHATRNYRVEVVPTYDHWEAYWIPRAGFGLARGWYRQLDLAQNRVLYRQPLSPAGYRMWLRRMAVRYVLLPRVHLSKKGAAREAWLLRSGRAGLTEVFRSADWRIYEFHGAVPLLRGPGPGGITAFTHKRIAGWAHVAGEYRLSVRYMPYWKVRGPACVTRAPDGMTLVHVRRAGNFVLASDGGAVALVRSPLRGGSGNRC